MATISEDYVSFETAKLLKEKGFDAECRYYYIQTGEMFEIDTRFHTVLTTQELLNLQIVGEKEERCVAPTLQMVMKWLREVYNMYIQPEITTWPQKGYFVKIYLYKNQHNDFEDMQFVTHKKSYEQACEAAIKYCLENLI